MNGSKGYSTHRAGLKEKRKGEKKKLIIEVLTQMKDWEKQVRMGLSSCRGDNNTLGWGQGDHSEISGIQ